MDNYNFKQYILRRLGHPNVKIEITEDQLDDVIEDALETYNEIHYNSTELKIIKIDLVNDQREYILPSNVINIKDVLNVHISDLDGLINLTPINFFNSYSMYNLRNMNTIENYYQWKTAQDLANWTWQNKLLFEFNQTNKIFRIFDDRIQNKNGNSICILAHCAVNSEETIYSDKWFKKYTVSLAGLQWATNIQKYGDVELPGGITIKASDLLSRYKDEVKEAEEELVNKYQEPIDFFVG